jgi:methyltransferase (TIGR00027 family)
MTANAIPVEFIGDTAFLTALYRAMETERPDAHFRDPYARALAGERGEHLAQTIPEGKTTAPGCVVRTCVMDDWIQRAIAQQGIDTVLNLGAGLDTRPYRLPLPPRLCWIEADLPPVLAYKARKLVHAQPACRVESVPLDLTDAIACHTLLKRIGKTAKQLLVVTEGVLLYMTPEQVTALAIDLSAQPQCRCWLTDLPSPEALHLLQQHLGQPTEHGSAKLQFAPPEGIDFFQKYGWQVSLCGSAFEEGQRLQRGALPKAALTQLSPQQLDVLRRLSCFVLLTRPE